MCGEGLPINMAVLGEQAEIAHVRSLTNYWTVECTKAKRELQALFAAMETVRLRSYLFNELASDALDAVAARFICRVPSTNISYTTHTHTRTHT